MERHVPGHRGVVPAPATAPHEPIRIKHLVAAFEGQVVVVERAAVVNELDVLIADVVVVVVADDEVHVAGSPG